MWVRTAGKQNYDGIDKMLAPLQLEPRHKTATRRQAQSGVEGAALPDSLQVFISFLAINVMLSMSIEMNGV